MLLLLWPVAVLYAMPRPFQMRSIENGFTRNENWTEKKWFLNSTFFIVKMFWGLCVCGRFDANKIWDRINLCHFNDGNYTRNCVCSDKFAHAHAHICTRKLIKRRKKYWKKNNEQWQYARCVFVRRSRRIIEIWVASCPPLCYVLCDVICNYIRSIKYWKPYRSLLL